MNPAWHEPLVVTDCCGSLLLRTLTLRGDSHFPDLCPACHWLDGRERDVHITCDWEQTACPGADWSYIRGTESSRN